MTAPVGSTTRAAPHVRARFDVQRLLAWFVLASVPPAAAGLWAQPAATVSFVSRAALAIAVCALWEWLFSRLRERPTDPAWLVNGWLFALLAPPETPMLMAAVSISIGVLLGHHVFGGTGRALVSPALLGVLVIHFGYPETALSASAFAVSDVGADSSVSWWSTLVAQPGVAVGSTSPLACAAGALLLLGSGSASFRVMLGTVAGVAAAGLLATAVDAAAPPWYWHLVIGNLAFATVFIVTDPSTGALSRGGRWAHGMLAGAFTVLIRWLDPAHPDGTLFAVLMAGLMVPLADHLTYRFHAGRLRRVNVSPQRES